MMDIWIFVALFAGYVIYKLTAIDNRLSHIEKLMERIVKILENLEHKYATKEDLKRLDARLRKLENHE